MQRKRPLQREQSPTRRRLSVLNGNGRPKRPRPDYPRLPRRRRRVQLFGRRLPLWTLIVAGALVLLTLDGAYAALRLRTSLLDARARFEAAGEAIRQSHFASARNELSAARDSGAAAVSATRHPGFLAAYVVPGISRDARALRAIADATELTAEAGLSGANAAQAMDPDQRGLAGSIYEEGRVHFDVLARGRPGIADAEQLLGSAAARLESAPQPSLGVVNDVLGEATDRISDAAESVHRGRTVIGALPSLLAERDTRTYLLALQAPGEARGTGGVIGLYGVLEARDGRLKLLEIAPYKKLQPRPIAPVRAPAWFRRRYGPLFGLRQWPQANLSPHFPEVSKVLLQMYKTATGKRLDGVIAMDPLSLAQMTKATGPFDTSLGEVNADNAADVLMHDSYVELPNPIEQNQFLEGLVVDFWDRVANGDVDAVALGGALGESVNAQHLKIFSTNPRDQAALAEMDADGDFTRYGPNLQFVYHNQMAVGKVDYFLERSIDTTIELNDSGDAHVTTTVSMTNNAPAGPPSPLLGVGNFGDPPGTSAMYLNFVLPQGARYESFVINGKRRPPFRAAEAGFPVVWEVVELGAGESGQAEITYTVPRAVDLNAEDIIFVYALLPQGIPQGDEFNVRIEPPFDYEAIPVSTDLKRAEDGALEMSERISEITRLEARLVPR